MKDVLTSIEVSELLDCSAETVNELALRGKLPGVKFGRSYVFPREALLEALNSRARHRRTSSEIVPIRGRRHEPPHLA